MSRDNGKKYPRTIESKNSYLRIRAPEHLDVALEGLIRKVLKEQPKMDDIYAFAADYFDMLLKIREKAGIRKLSAHDICPQHNEEDANDMIKVASTFTKRKKESKLTPRTYRAVSLKHGDHRHERRGMKTMDGDVENVERFNTVLSIVNERPELEESKPMETALKNEKPKSDSEENDLDIVEPKSQDPSEKIVEAREVIFGEDVEEDGTAVESDIQTVGDIDELRNKIIAVENEIQSLENKESKIISDGNSVDETKLEAEDVNTTEAVPIIEEPLQELDDLKPSVENEITVEEITAEDEGKQMEKEKASEGSAKRTGTEIETESDLEIHEVDHDVENIAQEIEEEKARILDIPDSDIQGTKNYNETLAEKTQESNEDIPSSRAEQTQEEKPSDDVSAEEENQESDVQPAAEETQEGKPSTEVSVEEIQEKNPSDDVSAEEENQESDVQPAAEETQEGKPSTEVSVEEIQEENVVGEVSAKETQKESQESDIQATTEVDPKEELVEESRHTPSSVELKTEESKTESEAASAVEEVEVVDTTAEGTVEETEDKENNTENDDTEEASSNKESTVVKVQSTDAVQAKEVELMEGEGPKNGKSGTEEFIDLEKQSQGIQFRDLSDEPTEVASTTDTVTHDEEKETDDDNVVITVPENAEEKGSEEDYIEHISESNDTGETEGLKPALPGAVAIASGIGAAAAMLDHAKKDLSDLKSEEIIAITKKTEETDQQSSIKKVLDEADAQKEEMTLIEEVETFLNRERQNSSYDKEKEELDAERQRQGENIKASDVEVMSENIPVSLALMTLPEKDVEDEKTPEKVRSGPSNVEAEGDDQDRDASTTSDEIEFEISPRRNAEMTAGSNVQSEIETGTHVENSWVNIPANEENDSKNMGNGKANDKPDSIIIQVNGSESEDQTVGDNVEYAATEEMKIFLEVPEPVVEEYPRRRVEDAIQGTEPEDQSRPKSSIEPPGNKTVNGEEAIMECANVGNEVLQTGEVQKVELIEGDEDILQVHLTTTIETVQENGDSLLLQMTSKIDPIFEISVETRVDSPVLDEKMKLIKAAVIIQNGFRRFRKRKVTGEPLGVSTDELDTSTISETKLDISAQTVLKNASLRESGSSFSSSATKISKGHNLSRSATRTLLETHSLDPIRKITPLKTRSLSTVRHGVADFDVWNQLVKELEEAATKIQSKYRGYKTRKKLQRGNAIQSTTTTSEDSSAAADSMEMGHRHTGEFHDSIVLPLPPNRDNKQ